MSASREKKQRQAAQEPVVSSRAQEEQAKAAQRKRNTIIYSVIGIVVVILVAALLIWDSGVLQRNSKVATIGGENVTASQVAYYYYNNDIIYYAQMYSSWGYAGFPYSLNASPKDQVITAAAAAELGLDEGYVDKTYHEYFLDMALNSLRQECALRAAAKEAGYTLSAEGKASVDEAFVELDSTLDSYLANYGADLTRTAYLQMTYGKSMSESKYRTCLENATLADEFYSQYLTTFAGYSEAELDAYYQANKDAMDTVTYYWRLFDGAAESTTDAEGNTVEPTEEEEEAALTAAKEEADAALAAVQADPNLVKDNEDYTESTALLPNTSSLYHDWLADAARQPGDATIFDGTTGTSYYLVVFGERYRDETPTVNVRHALIQAVNEDDPATEADESTQDPTDEAFDAAKEKAEELLAQWKAGEATEESFAALAEEHSVDTGSNTNGGLYEKISQGAMIPTFNDWIFDDARQSGDTGLVINTESSTKQGWHIIYFVGRDEPVWITAARRGQWAEDVKNDVEIVRTNKLDSIAD